MKACRTWLCLLLLALAQSAWAEVFTVLRNGSGEIVAFRASGAWSNSCVPEDRRHWRAEVRDGVLRLYAWDNLIAIGEACFSAARTYEVLISVRDVCLQLGGCRATRLQAHRVSGCDAPIAMTRPACLDAFAFPLRTEIFEAAPIPRGLPAVSGPWLLRDGRLFLLAQEAGYVLHLEQAGRVQAVAMTAGGSALSGTVEIDGSAREIFVAWQGANLLINDVGGPAVYSYRTSAAGTPIFDVYQNVGFAGQGATTMLELGGTYALLDPAIDARQLQLESCRSHAPCRLTIDGRYGGSIQCTFGRCEVEFATRSGLIRKLLSGSQLGYEVLLEDVASRPTAWAVRLAGPR